MGKTAFLPKNNTEFAWLSGITVSFPSPYHWTWYKGKLRLHRGRPEDCKRVHYNRSGQKEARA